jgi:ATP-dependent Clp protease ATP-binding subunit ClpC
MFERFTDSARRVVVLAQEEARMLSHNYIGTEHLLLGLIHEGEGVAARALEALGIRIGPVREQVVDITGRGEHAPSGHIPFTPRAKKVLELALRESRQLGHNYIGTEHILLGLIREGEGVAARVLVSLGADLNRARQQVIELLHGFQGKEAGLGAPSGAMWSRLPGRGRLEDIGGKLDVIADRLTAIEHRLGISPGPKPEALPQAGDAPAAPESDRLRREVERLRALLRRHDSDPGDDPAPPGAAAGA